MCTVNKIQRLKVKGAARGCAEERSGNKCLMGTEFPLFKRERILDMTAQQWHHPNAADLHSNLVNMLNFVSGMLYHSC